MAHSEEARTRFQEIEDRQLMIARHLENQLSGPDPAAAKTTESKELLSSVLTANSTNNQQLKALEKRIGKKVADSVEQLGDIIKQYAR